RRKAELYKRLGIQTIDPTYWGINRVVDLLCYSPLDTVYSLGAGEVDIVEAEVPALLVGRTVKELMIPGESVVTAISRGNKTFLPTMGTEFMKRDIIHMAVSVKSCERLKTLLGR
ncbi:MAG: TrkA C-terminal domain-containing protein, partial [Bacillota bacterium]|nr:TrkA C-terminal domain-containing protein [Bacillota bacterium]